MMTGGRDVGEKSIIDRWPTALQSQKLPFFRLFVGLFPRPHVNVTRKGIDTYDFGVDLFALYNFGDTNGGTAQHGTKLKPKVRADNVKNARNNVRDQICVRISLVYISRVRMGKRGVVII